MSESAGIPELWRKWTEEDGPVDPQPVAVDGGPRDGVWFDFHVTPTPATAEDIAALYDRCSGVPGWVARIEEGNVFLTPPPGYVVAHGEDGSRRLVKISSIRPMVISIRETAP